jgi:DNA polymerase-3 subunit beta
MIRQTIFSIASNENNKVMTGELFEIRNNVFSIVSLDGHRISIRRMNLSKDYQDIKVIVPGKTLNEICKLLSGELDDQITIIFSDNHIIFEMENTVIVSRLIEGEYFRIDQMLSKDYETKLKVNKREFLECIDRSSLLVKEGDKKPLIIRVLGDEMDLFMESQLGTMNEEISIEKEGKDILIGFNPRFLMDALRSINEDAVTIYMINTKAPCYIRDEQESYTYLILPVTINESRYT